MLLFKSESYACRQNRLLLSAYADAVVSYSEALKLFPPSCEEEVAACHANRAACYMKMVQQWKANPPPGVFNCALATRTSIRKSLMTALKASGARVHEKLFIRHEHSLGGEATIRKGSDEKGTLV